ncbi:MULTISPECIES: Bug family tripartite tricarboxylate transporter substrate binding protein [unclassified Cupriavidus]|uniref:Bug family tripartite tricarboxylate transporter substrate binding protein n=1 Tax=Cupriavidus sp. H19C3 TaxID=3241603 RepID=UPI0011D9B58C|nr:MAG: tripartite tricarboxylate transporter substrate binding protein [Cupriavidus sp.]
MTRIQQIVLAAAFGLLTGATQAQDAYPAKPITLLVGFAPSGGTDIIARQLGQKLGERLKQPVVIENRAGASGTIAAGAVARAKPDGYTLLVGHVSSNAMVPAITPRLAYDPQKDFTPIVLIGTVPQVVVVPASSPAKTLAEFIALCRQKQGAINYASSGVGTQQHFAAELFESATGVTMTHVPYKGSGAALTDLLSGMVDVNFDTVPTVLQYIRSGRLRALAVTTPTRIASLPDVPTVAEAGVPGYAISAWYMLMGPAHLPDHVRDTLNQAVNESLKSPDLREKLGALSTELGGGTAAAARDYLKSEVVRWQRVAAEKKIVAE